MIEELSTKRLTLRSPRRGDAPSIAAGLGNFNVTRFLTKVPFPYTEQDAGDWIDRVSSYPPSQEAFVIEQDEAGVIGVIGLESELGYWLAEPHWGHGYATEAAAAALAWYFATVNAESIASGAHEDNPASLNVQRKLGFEITGERTDFSISRRQDVRIVRTTLTRAIFERKGYLS